MSKTKEELELLKQEYKSLNDKLLELSDEELRLVTGGMNLKPLVDRIVLK